MASWSPSSSPSPTTPSPLQATAVSDCPQCGSVCVGGLLLPCGHLTCRKCLRDHHGSQLTCHTCQHRLPLPKDQGSAEFTSLVQHLGVDPVMALMVNERLRGQGRQACLVCENREATTVCQDCNEFYCHSCARMHGRQRMSRDHVMQPLPQALRNVSSADCAVPKPRPHSDSSCDAMDIISNPMDQPKSRGPSRGSTRWKQWVRREVGMLQAALSDQDALVTGLNDVLAIAEKRQNFLQFYAKSLSLFDVTQQDDNNTFNVTVTHDDVSMQVKLDSLQQRLRDVIVGPQDASFTSDVSQLIKQLDDVLSMQGNWSTTQSVGLLQSSTTQSVGVLQSSTTRSVGVLQSSTTQSVGLLQSSTTQSVGVLQSSTTRSVGVLQSSTTRSVGVLQSSTTQSVGVLLSSTTRSVGVLQSSTTRSVGVLQSSTTQSVGVLQSSTASSQASVTSPSLSSPPFATPTVNMSTPTSTAATPTSTAATPTSTAATPTSTAATPTSTVATTTSTAATPTSTAANTTSTVATPTSTAATPTSTAANTTSTAATPTSTAATPTSTAANTTSTVATPTSTAPKTSNTLAVTPSTSTLVATTIISNSAVMPANNATTPTTVSFSYGVPTATTVSTVATPTAATVNSFTTISSVAKPTNNAVTPTNTTNVIVTPTNTSAHAATTHTNATPTTNIMAVSSAISALADISAETTTAPTITVMVNTSTPISSVATPTTTAVTSKTIAPALSTTTSNTITTPINTNTILMMNTTFLSIINLATPTNILDKYSNNSATPSTTTVPPTDNQATPTTTLDTKLKSTKNIIPPSTNTTAPLTDKQATPTSTPVTNPMSSTKDRATSNRTSITKPGMVTDTTTTTKDKPTLASTTTTNTVEATAAVTTTPSPFSATTSTCTPSVDPMTARRAFSVRPVCDDDSDTPYITSIISTRDGQRLVMTDRCNKVKVVDLHNPHKVSAALTVIERPHCLALLPDDLVAMTNDCPVIYLLKIKYTVSVTSRIQTDVTYRGVGGLSDGRLIVSCDIKDNKVNKGVARVDIITRDGNVVTTITDSKTLTRLKAPWYLSVVDSHVLLSDWYSDAVYKVDISSGHLVDTFTHPDLRSPHQLTADGSGNVYITSEWSQCVLVRSAGGQWRTLVEASQQSDEGYDMPRGVCLTSDGRLVVAWNKGLSDSVVIAYDLSSTLITTTIIISNSVAMPANTPLTPSAATVNALATISSAATPTNNAVTPTNNAVTTTNKAVTPTNTLDTKLKSTKNSITPFHTNVPPTDNQATPTSTTVTSPPVPTNKDGATSTITKSDMASKITTTTTRDGAVSTCDGATPSRNTPRTTKNGATPAKDGATPSRNTPRTTKNGATPAKDGATPARNTTSTTRDRAMAAITTTPSPFSATTSTCTPSVDPMTARPRRAFSVRPVCDDDSSKPLITSIISTRDGQRLVMTDSNNNKVKVVDLHPPHKVYSALTVIERPHCLALLPDNLVAMTTCYSLIYLVEITDAVTVTSRIKTDVTYRGVAGLSDGTLIVSCDRDDNKGVARVDIITRDGNVVTTITDTKTLTRLWAPLHLSVMDSHVLLSDWTSRAVYKVDISSGHLVDTFTHPNLSYPRQLTADGSGNAYIASVFGHCVLVRSAGGQWRKLLEASQHSDEGYDKPRGVCLTSAGRLVVAWWKGNSDSVVIAYDLSSTLKSTTNSFTPFHRNAPPTDNQATPTSISVTSPPMPTNKDGATSTTLKSRMASRKPKTTTRDGAASTSDIATPSRNTPRTTKNRATAAVTNTASPVCATTSTCTPSVDPMTARPRRAFSFKPVCDEERRKPLINTIISTRDGQRLVMTDTNNSMVKVVDLHHPHKVYAALTVIERPHCLALLPDDLVAMTTYRLVIYLLKITDTVTVTSRIQTDVTYQGVGGLSDGRLIVSCNRDDNEGVARVDIITRNGNVVTTITDTNTLTRLKAPWYLSVMDSHVLLSDCVSSSVYKVDIGSGHLVHTFTHPDMRSPRQLTSDGSGNVYITSEDGRCVLVRSAGGQWRELVEASQHSDEGYDKPRGVCLTSNGRLVVVWRKFYRDSVVIVYDLSSTLVATTIINNSVPTSFHTATTPTTPLTPAAATVNSFTTFSSADTPTSNAVTPTNTTLKSTNKAQHHALSQKCSTH